MSYFVASEGALKTGAAVVGRKRSISRFAATMRAALFAGVLLGALVDRSAGQTVINVTVANDTGTTSGGSTGGASTLSAALAQINASTPPGGFIINLQTNVTLSGPLSPIFNSVTINGNGYTISGNNTSASSWSASTPRRRPARGWRARSSRTARRWRSTTSSCPRACPGRRTAPAGRRAGAAAHFRQPVGRRDAEQRQLRQQQREGRQRDNQHVSRRRRPGGGGGSAAAAASSAAAAPAAAAFSAVPLPLPAAAAIAAPAETARTAPRASCR